MNKINQLTALKLITTLCFASFAYATSADNTIKITPELIGNLGVTLGQLTPVSSVPLLSAPAKVTIPPAHEHVVSASQAGLIVKLNASVGDKVNKGAVLAQITSPDLLALQGRYLKANSVLQLAAATYQRDIRLLKDGVIAGRREQETLSAYNAAVLDVNEAKQLLEIAGMTAADIQLLKDKHQFTSQFMIRAPVTGVILERMATVGTHIDMLAPLYKLANLDELWVDIAIPQEKIGSIKIGDSVLIENTAVQAEIKLLGQSVNPDNQTLLARAVIKGTQVAVRAGQRVNIQIVQALGSVAFKVPNTAIAQNAGKAYLFVQSPSGFTVSPIQVVGKLSNESIIQGEFKGDEKIAVKGAVALKANWLGLGSEE
ncbi:MAG: efflux RND transporter periplasmic adaptor subunit [Methylococcaceae bacterium]|nr:efflux RND transporter periplasmic adaptor subunit [Methylococcaceae bacterium]